MGACCCCLFFFFFFYPPTQVAAALLASGANPNFGQRLGARGTPLLYASGTGQLAMVHLLLAHPNRADPNAPSGHLGGHLRPLHAALAQGARALRLL